MTDFAPLASRLTGELLTPDDTGFEDSTAGFNSAIVHHPDAVVLPADEDDVAETVRFARAEGLPVRVVATGHGGTVGYTHGIVLAMQELNEVSIDAGARTATFGGGTPWGLVTAAAATHGLAPIVGSSPTVGAVGYLLGGGIGPLARSHGISSDYLRSLRVVTGEGEAVTASAEEHPDLFWALRGGKGGLGVVVEATVALVELGTIYGGTMFFDIADAGAVIGGWIAWARDADPRVTSSAGIVRFPDVDMVPPPMRGRHLVGIRFAFPGGEPEGEPLAAPLRALAPVHLDGLGVLPAAEIARIHNDPTEPAPGWGLGAALTGLDDAFATALLGQVGAGTDSPFVAVDIRLLGGAVTRDVEGGSAIGGREVEGLLHLVGSPQGVMTPELLEAAGARMLSALAPWISPASTINWVSTPSDPVAFASAWTSESFARLATVREKYDPDHVFPYGPA
jgi:hypothetical protein